MRNLAYWKEKAVQCRNASVRPECCDDAKILWRNDLTYALRKVEQIERKVGVK
jgi:hypothetical protein